MIINVVSLVTESIFEFMGLPEIRRIMRTLLLGGGTLLKETTLLGVGV